MKLTLVLFAALFALASAAPNDDSNPFSNLLSQIQEGLGSLNVSNIEKFAGEVQKAASSAGETIKQNSPDVKKVLDDLTVTLGNAAKKVGLPENQEIQKAFNDAIKTFGDKVEENFGTAKKE